LNLDLIFTLFFKQNDLSSTDLHLITPTLLPHFFKLAFMIILRKRNFKNRLLFEIAGGFLGRKSK